MNYKESLTQTLNLFNQGNSISEISHKRKLAISTIENHLRKLLEEKKIGLSELLDYDKIKQIEEAAENCNSLREIKEKLIDEISYGEIKYVLAVSGRLKKKKKSEIEKAINTYIGNYCFRKCFNHDKRIKECLLKFDVLRKSLNSMDISFKEFNDMMKSGEISVCKLSHDGKVRYVSWKYFEYLKDKDTDFWDLKK